MGAIAGITVLDVWQDDAALIAKGLGIPCPKVHFGPPWLMEVNAGITIPHRIYINPRARDLSPAARRYVLAHELGHVLHGHSKAAYLALAACMLLAYASPLAADVVMGLYIGAFLVPNGLGDRAEYQADAVAAKVMGSSLSTIIAQQE